MTGMHHDRLLSCEAFFKDAPCIISRARDERHPAAATAPQGSRGHGTFVTPAARSAQSAGAAHVLARQDRACASPAPLAFGPGAILGGPAVAEWLESGALAVFPAAGPANMIGR